MPRPRGYSRRVAEAREWLSNEHARQAALRTFERPPRGRRATGRLPRRGKPLPAELGFAAVHIPPVVVGLLIIVPIAGVGLSSRLDLSGSITIGILIVVALGTGGLICRGVGELRADPNWKAGGYFLGASAYVATACVALFNSVPALLSR